MFNARVDVVLWGRCTLQISIISQELLDVDMPDLPEYQAPQEQSDISIELQFPSGIADVS